MFCGEALVGDQKFTEAEKDAIRVREEHHKEMHEIRREGDATYQKWKNNDPYADWTDFF
ncbi:hypothetical protein [Agarilytica rhodophyticola]|uniref:hypothetical protein n=1 Tax=Agarilytica rhodophyticola TaxID=1737490 RepID=UPI00131A44C1|nr:hypothetical protein [Agarilytica rhodophyticola]